MSIEEETETLELAGLTPEGHYAFAIDELTTAQNYGVDSPHRTNLILSALTHAMLGGLRDGLDYSAKVAAREAREASAQNLEGYAPPVIEEDDRP